MEKIKRLFLTNRYAFGILITIGTYLLLGFLSTFSAGDIQLGKMIERANLGIWNSLIDTSSPVKKAHPSIVLVAIDNASLSDETWLGRFQDFERWHYAKVIDNLKAAGAIVIGIDVLFSEKSKDVTQDLKLAKSMERAGNVVLGFSSAENLMPLPMFQEKALGLGYFHPNINPTNEVVYGLHPYRIKNGKASEAFSVVIARKYFEETTRKEFPTGTGANVETRFGWIAYKIADKAILEYANENTREVYVSYLPKGAKFRTVSFANAYNNKFDPAEVRDKIVLIWSTATGLFDKFNTPGGVQDGVLIHANMVNTILQREYIGEMNPQIEGTIIVAIILLLAIFIISIKNWAVQIVTGIILVLLSSFSVWMYFTIGSRLAHYPIQLLLGIFLITLFVVLYKYIYEEKGKRVLKEAFSQYLAENLVHELLNNFQEVNMNGTRREVTAFFSDIEWFTTISEKMEPEELVSFLSIYLSALSDVIVADKGFINKYEGDAIMALWGNFGHEKEQAYQACIAAIHQQQKIAELNESFRESHGFTINVRMGINKGPAVVGNIGSKGKKIEYTALGDTINTASRFEGINKVYGTKICVGPVVYEETKDRFLYRKLDRLRVKGKDVALELYELMATKEEATERQKDIARSFEEALQAYVAGEIPRAKQIFEHLVGQYGDKPSVTFIERCDQLLKNGLPENWDGIYRATEK